MQLESSCKFIFAAAEIFEKYGYSRGSQWPDKIQIWADDHCLCGYLVCVDDLSEVPPEIDLIGKCGSWFWWLDDEESFLEALGTNTYNALIFDLGSLSHVIECDID